MENNKKLEKVNKNPKKMVNKTPKVNKKMKLIKTKMLKKKKNNLEKTLSLPEPLIKESKELLIQSLSHLSNTVEEVFSKNIRLLFQQCLLLES